MAQTRVSTEVAEVLISGGTTTVRVSSQTAEALMSGGTTIAQLSTLTVEVLMTVDDVPTDDGANICILW